MLLYESEVGVSVDAVKEVGLFVIVGGEDDIKDNSFKNLFPISITAMLACGAEIAYTLQLRRIFNHTRCAIHRPIVLANIDVFIFLLRQLDLLVVELELQVGYLNIVEVLCRDLPRENRGLCEVTTLNTQLDLLQDEIRLFPSVHRPKGLDLEFTKDISCTGEVASGLTNVREDTGYAGALDFDKDLNPECQLLF